MAGKKQKLNHTNKNHNINTRKWNKKRASNRAKPSNSVLGIPQNVERNRQNTRDSTGPLCMIAPIWTDSSLSPVEWPHISAYPSICPLYPHHCWFGLSPHELPIAADHYPHSTLPQPGLACDICRGSVSSSAVTGNRCRENPNHRWSRMGGSLLGPFFVGFKTHGNQRLAEICCVKIVGTI